MARNASKVPFLRVMTKRGLFASECQRPIGQVSQIESTVLGNKVIVAAADSALPITRVAVVFRAGARNETYDNLGASHMLRIAAGQTTMNSSGFAITRNLQQIGGSLTVTGDREIVAYSIETTAIHIETGLRYLQDSLQPSFKPWELTDSIARIKTQVAGVLPQVHAVELLHKVAFRHGLGNSIYIPKFHIGSLSSETLLHYVANNFTAGRCAVVGVGVEHKALSEFAQGLELGSDDSKPDSASYYGGDARKDTPGDIAHVAVAGQGGALLNQKETLAFAVLQNAVGSAPAAKRGEIHGNFGKAITSAISDASFSYAPLNASYADAGLFGFVVSTDSEHIGKAVESLARALKSGTVSDEDVKRGKALLKSQVLETYATDSTLLSEMAVQAAVTKKVHTAEALVAAIDGITQKEVQDAARKAGSSNLSVGAVGNLNHVPYASELA